MIPTDKNNLLDFNCHHCNAEIMIAPVFHIYKGVKYEDAVIFSFSEGEARPPRIVYDGEEYSPSRAGTKITGNQVRGPTFWKFKTKKGDTITLAQLAKSL